MRMMIRLAPAMLGLLLLCGGEAQARTRKSRVMTFEATANSVEGTTASGRGQRTRLVAADPDVLPLGTRIRVLDAGPFSGVYTVADTGPKVQGRKIDFYLPDDAAAKRFGKRTVKVQVLSVGHERVGEKQPDAQTADRKR
jgi:3D (Asp-Asp-Asp) domain-containing protein